MHFSGNVTRYCHPRLSFMNETSFKVRVKIKMEWLKVQTFYCLNQQNWQKNNVFTTITACDEFILTRFDREIFRQS